MPGNNFFYPKSVDRDTKPRRKSTRFTQFNRLAIESLSSRNSKYDAFRTKKLNWAVMQIHRIRHGCTQIARLLTLEISKTNLWYFVIALDLTYVIVAVHIPLTLYPGAGHDDGLYINLGRNLAEGNWLGPFSQYTLMKGPGYPAFLAVANWLGTSVSLAHALLHCFAVSFFTLICYRFVRSGPLTVLLFLLLLWQPVPLTVFLLRIVREEIYSSQVLVLFAGLIASFFLFRNRRSGFALSILTGVIFGWFWLTREEASWILPAVGFLVIVAGVHAYLDQGVRRFFAMLSIIVGVFGAMQVGFRAMNLHAYGKFVGVDVKERNFERALGAIQSVRSGGIKAFIPVTRAARQYIYRVSPAFASLKPYFDPPNEVTPTAGSGGWTGYTCALVPDACGEIAAGWFLWALRDAVSQQGHYASPAKASEFFGQIADEISVACARGNLECRPQLIAELPPVSWGEVVSRLPSRFRRAFDFLAMTNYPRQFNESAGDEGALAGTLRFLNYPLYTLPGDAQNLATYRINGWYYKSGRDWFSVMGKSPAGGLEIPHVQRTASPDLPGALNDESAENQRFTIQLRCVDECVLIFTTQDGAQLEKPLSELQRGLAGFKFGGANLVVESVQKYPNPLASQTRAERLANRARIIALKYHPLAFLPTLALGAIALLAATFVYWRIAIFNIAYVLALTSWMLVFLRVLLLSFIDATSFPALQAFYLSPVYFMAISAAVLSLTAWLQLSGLMAEPYPLRREHSS